MANFWKTLKPPITVLAPMYDVTDYVFREIIAEVGKPDVLFTEFVSTDTLTSTGKAVSQKKLRFSERQRPIVAQIWGANPQNYAKSAKYLTQLGFDGIDINTGCPSRSVMKRGCGAALINNMQLVSEIVEAIRENAPNITLSIKTRLADSSAATNDWLSFLLSLELAAITLHARTAKDMSRVPANWDEIGKLVQLKDKTSPQTVIIGNGDVLSYQEAVQKHQTYGVDGVMIGRGIFQNPWLFETKGPPKQHTPEEHIKLLKKHTKLYNETWADTGNFEVMKKFFKVYIKGFDGAKELREQLMHTKGYRQFKHVLKANSR